MRVGLVGCGNIGRLRAEAVRRSERLRLAAAVDVDRERAASAAGGDAAVGTDWREVLAAAELDAVIVSTPPSTHVDVCRGAAEAGCHVLCEKPLARSPEECRQIVDAAGEAGVRLATGFNFRFFPPARKARQILEEGVMGRVLHLRGHAGYRATDPSPPWIHDAAETGGGALRDIGVHLIDLARHFLGEVEEVAGAATNEALGIDGCEDNADLVLRSADAGVAGLHVSWTEWRGYRFWVEISGTRAVARLSFFPMLLSVSPRTAGQLSWRQRHHVFPRSFLAEHVGSYEKVVVESLVRELESFADFVAGRPAAVATGVDGLRAVEVADAVGRSFRGGDAAGRRAPGTDAAADAAGRRREEAGSG